jgi:hypothetical protein
MALDDEQTVDLDQAMELVRRFARRYGSDLEISIDIKDRRTGRPVFMSTSYEPLRKIDGSIEERQTALLGD